MLTTSPALDKNPALASALSSGLVIVRFTKLDGTDREMLCTRSPEIINAKGAQPTGDGNRRPSSSSVPVLEVLGDGTAQWRSFVLANLKEWTA